MRQQPVRIHVCCVHGSRRATSAHAGPAGRGTDRWVKTKWRSTLRDTPQVLQDSTPWSWAAVQARKPPRGTTTNVRPSVSASPRCFQRDIVLIVAPMVKYGAVAIHPRSAAAWENAAALTERGRMAMAPLSAPAFEQRQ